MPQGFATARTSAIVAPQVGLLATLEMGGGLQIHFFCSAQHSLALTWLLPPGAISGGPLLKPTSRRRPAPQPFFVKGERLYTHSRAEKKRL
jgi:hypothetical protein